VRIQEERVTPPPRFVVSGQLDLPGRDRMRKYGSLIALRSEASRLGLGEARCVLHLARATAARCRDLFISQAVGGHEVRQVLISDVFQQACEFTGGRGGHCGHGHIFSRYCQRATGVREKLQQSLPAVCNDPLRGQRVRLGKHRSGTPTACKPR
jgi:hypothetical protein